MDTPRRRKRSTAKAASATLLRWPRASSKASSVSSHGEVWSACCAQICARRCAASPNTDKFCSEVTFCSPAQNGDVRACCHAVDRSPSLRCKTSTRRLASSSASSWPRRHSRMSATTAAVSSASLFIFLSRVASWRANRGPSGATSSPSSSSSLAIFSNPSKSTRNATAARHLRSRPWRSNPCANASTPCSFSKVNGGTKLPGASCTSVAWSRNSCARLRTAAPWVA
mmetsp:Transcript_19283/g.50166  ORF Transcript_19283/g.50166 Transcript_19283/m.50166 type:complete len:227 (-) Transcript_19283:298-978(-)